MKGSIEFPNFWMGGRYATGLQEISHNPASLGDGNFWALSTTFEGEFIAARFSEVREMDFPHSENWSGVGGKWSTSISQQGYLSYVRAIQDEIAAGWVYQVNACRQLSAPLTSGATLRGLFSQILKNNPAPRASYLEIPGINIASASPELFLSRQGNFIKTSPIKGTKRLDQLEPFGGKDIAENIMIVDLMRNDLGQICESGSVNVPRLLASETHPGLTHLVSDVSGKLKSGVSWESILSALLPPGSVSGAPKSSALDVIARNELQPRGPYCGALGWVQGDQCELSVAIRIFWESGDGVLRFGTGAGITWGSEPQSEWEESELKAARLISIAGGARL